VDEFTSAQLKLAAPVGGWIEYIKYVHSIAPLLLAIGSAGFGTTPTKEATAVVACEPANPPSGRVLDKPRCEAEMSVGE